MLRQTLAFLLIAAFLLIPSSGGADENAQAWRKYFFDGKEFREGAALSGAQVMVREGCLPVMLAEKEAVREDRLPAGTGGLVLLCYIESAGGKLQSHSGYAPLAGAAIEITGNGRTMAIRSDREGYSVLALPPGEYEVQVRALVKRVKIEKGKTAFVAVRAGKRMVD